MYKFTVKILNFNKEISVKRGTTLLEISKDFKNNFKGLILNGKVDSELKSLDYAINSDCEIEFFDATSDIGFRTYQKSCLFIMLAAANEVLGNERVVWAEHTVNKNYFCCVYDKELSDKELLLIKKKMKEYVNADYKIERLVVTVDEAKEIFNKYGLHHRIKSLRYINRKHLTLYKVNNFYDYLYGPMVPSTSYIPIFDIIRCDHGFLLKFVNTKEPDKINDTVIYPKLMNIFNEHNQWSRILNIDTVGALNESIAKGTFKQNIWVAEALHEKKIAEIADCIKLNNKRIILIAGPSSSGKTTFSKRLSIQLLALGITPHIISLDDYYINRDNIPTEPDGTKNFERLSTIDVDRFNEDILVLLDGKVAETPLFDFKTGSRKSETKKIALCPKDVLIIEGIHGINENLTYRIPKEYKYKIYISALTQLNIDEHNRISTADTRLIRRIIRDNTFRGFSAKNTLEMWKMVVEGEEENIYPYQEQADIMFNTSLIYEIGVLKPYAEPLLYEIEKGEKTYLEATRLLNLLNCFLSVDSQNVPLNSLIREFIGGSCFM